jgi:SAM-dependent methyltransferase
MGDRMSWLQYWNGTPTIFASARHREAHDLEIAMGIIQHIPAPSSRVLDFGCGEATRARIIAHRCRHLYLWDASDTIRQRLTNRHGDCERISVLTADSLHELEPRSIDLIIVSSVVQYLSASQLAEMLEIIRSLLSERGHAVIADVIPPAVSPLRDARQLLTFAWQGRFLLATLLGLVRTAFSSYRATRARCGFSMFTEAEFMNVLRRHGLAGRRLPTNLGHNQARMAFIAVHDHPDVVPRCTSQAGQTRGAA